MRPTWIVIGAGYTGERIATSLVDRGDSVVITRRSAEAAAAVAVRTGARAAVVDLRAPDSLARMLVPGSIVVVTAPPIDELGTGEAALASAAALATVGRIIYLSSTAVYAPAAGAWVDEEFTTAPIAATGRARLAAEAALAAGEVGCVRLRVAGIYGPDRGVVARLRAGTYRLVGGGNTQVSRVHVDDLVSAIVMVGDAAAPGPVYNVADRDPCTSRELALAACAALRLPLPPSVSVDAVDAEVAAMLTADRRIDATRLTREIGWSPRVPSARTAIE